MSDGSRRTRANIILGLILGLTAVTGAMLVINASAVGFEMFHVILLTGMLAIAVVGRFIVARTGNVIGWLFLTLALGGVGSSLAETYLINSLVVAREPLPLTTFAAVLSNAAGLMLVLPLPLIFLLFPSGTPAGGRWRRAVHLWVMGAIALGGWAVLRQGVLWGHPRAPSVQSPFHLPSIEGLIAGLLVFGGAVVFLSGVLGVISLFLRYRRARGEERLQIRWLASVAVLGLVDLLCSLALNLVFGDPGPSWVQTVGDVSWIILTVLVALGMPAAVSIAVLRYRLYEIDTVINKTVVFGALGAFITAVYVGIVVGIGALLGQGDRANAGLQIAATAVVALAFQPVRRRVQRLANRLVYGQRATPYEVMADFTRRMAGALEVDGALTQMAEAAARGVGATAGRVRLFLPGGSERVVTWPVDAPTSMPTRAIEVHHQGAPIGEIAVTKTAGDALLPAEDGLLQDLAAQAGLALHNVRLTDELEARLEELAIQADQLKTSRQRLVTARDAQRRGLERDIREGPRRTLTGIAAGVERARDLASSAPDEAAAELDRLGEQANHTLEGLRDLARGIFPPLLADQGIVPALDAHVRKVGVRATLEVAPGLTHLRFDDRVEACVYFCCLQALQNVARHAGATSAVVRLSAEAGTLEFAVHDDGRGFAPADTPRGMGMDIMQDRVDALDGELVVTSAPGAGTTVTGRIPARAMESAS